NIRLLPLQGALLIAIIPRALPWAMSFWAFSPYLSYMRKFSFWTNRIIDGKSDLSRLFIFMTQKGVKKSPRMMEA
ncbi:MAG: hypothetical protein UFD09_08360, partial [Prevotella sp.]|nr:hypothetical protein [Prevotella sp.]